MKKRVWAFDLARAFCVIWIVAVWHNSIVNNNDLIGISITIGVLGGFTYLSGILSGGKFEYPLTTSQVFKYYANRLLRLYPLFALSCVCFYLIGIIPAKQLLFSLTGFAIFRAYLPPTLWYVIVIFIYYFVTPFICCQQKTYQKIIVSGVIFALMAAIKFIVELGYIPYVSHVDNRLLYFFPVYCFGLIIKNNVDVNLKRLIIFAAIALISCIVFIFTNVEDIKLFIAIGLGVTLVSICQYIEKIRFYHGRFEVIKWMSYASMLVYMFHREYNFLIARFCVAINFEQQVVMRLLFLPIFFALCYFVQRGYDLLIFRKKKADKPL